MTLWGRIKALLTRERPHHRGYLWYPRTQAGQYVDEEMALRYSAVWGCVRVISEGVACLPWQVFRRGKTGKKEVTDDTAWMLQNQPNSEMSPFIFKELLVRRMLLSGNGYAEIERDNGGRPVALWPIISERVTPDRDENGALIYRVRDIEQGEIIMSPANIFHLKGPGGDGLVGYSIIRMAAEAIGLGLAMQDFGSSFFGNGAHMGGVLQHPKQLSQQAQDRLKESFNQSHARKNALSMAVLEEGMTYQRIGIPPEDAQFLESRSFSVVDICRWFRVPPHKVAELGRATWGNIEQLSIEFVQDAIVPTACRMEQEADAKFFGRNNRGVVYTQMNVSALLRGDMKSRNDAYAVGRQWGWLSPNEIREQEGMNPIPGTQGGDMYLVPANMMSSKKAKAAEAQPIAAPSPPNDPETPGNPGEPPKNRKRLNANGVGHA